MSATAQKGRSKPDAARTKKIAIGALGLIVLVYVGSSMMEKGASNKPKPKLAATATTTPGGTPVATPSATPGGPVALPASSTGSVPTTTPWLISPRNPFGPATQS